MRAIIVGCGRVGAGIAERLARAGHDVTIIDISGEAFKRLEADYPGKAVRGDGTDEDVLRRAGAEGADYFFGVTEGDNRNILTAQLAGESLGVANVVAKVNDPVRSEAYRELGIATICRTTMMVDALGQHVGLPSDPGAAGVSVATGRHPGGGHDDDGEAGHTAAEHTSDPSAASSATPGGRTAAEVSSGGAAGAPDAAATGKVDVAGDGRGRRAWKLLRRTGEREAED